jgi:hypothetical protein
MHKPRRGAMQRPAMCDVSVDVTTKRQTQQRARGPQAGLPPVRDRSYSVLKSHWVQHDLEHELLRLDDFCPEAAARFPPSVRVNRIARGLNRDTCRMAFHDAIEHSPRSSRVVSIAATNKMDRK